MTNKVEQIHTEVAQLDGHVLTVYLNTDPAREDWKIRLKNGLRKMTEYVEASNPNQLRDFKKIRQKVDRAIKDQVRAGANSIVCFANKDKLLIYPLQLQVDNDFSWEDEAKTEQLQTLCNMYGNSGVVLVQRDKVTLLSHRLGELVDETHFEFDIESRHWKQYKGVAFGNIYSSSANHREKFNRRMRENQKRWFKQLIPLIEQHAKRQGWSGVHLVGPKELTNDLKEMLRIHVIGETSGNYAYKSAHQVLERTLLA